MLVSIASILMILFAAGCPADDEVPACGNGFCDEIASTCPADCPSGGDDGDDGDDDPPPEVDAGPPVSVPDASPPTPMPDAAPPGPSCGDSVCNGGETATSCPADCVVCGDNRCEGSETPSTCAADCTACGNLLCEVGETLSSCPTDCGASLRVRNNSSYTVYYLYLAYCGGAWSTDQLGSAVINPGGSFLLTRIPPGCYYFRAQTAGSVYWQTPSGVSLPAGQTYTWTLYN
jgi:hypothetical protein